MTSGHKLLFWILVFSLKEAVDAYPQFTCGPFGIKHDINQRGDGKPQVTCLRPRQSVHLDAHVQIECEVISGTFANITWFHNGISLSELKKSFVTIDKRSCGQTLKIRYASSRDEGKYTCAATNKFGTVNKTCSLHIKVYPQFTCGPLGLKHDINQTEDGKPQVTCLGPWQSVHLDAHVQIECEVISGTFANITWFHNGISLSELKKSFVTIDKRSCGQTLKIRYTSSRHEGKYTCAATNKFGTVNETCYLHILPINEPEVEYFKIADNRQTAYLNGTVELKCKLLHVDAHMWLLNGTRISHGDRHKMIRDTTICKPRKLFTLKIINVTENDEGRYTCSGYKNGIKAAKDLFLKTEPCPSGHYCPPEGNTAFPFPRSPPTPTPGISKEYERETMQVTKTQRGRLSTSEVTTQRVCLKTELVLVSRGYSFHRPDTVRILLFAVLAFTYNRRK